MDFDGLQYIVDTENMQAKLSGMLSHETAELIVPDFIIYEDQLVPVTEVFEYSFSESNLVSVSLGNNILKIGEGAFAFCSSSFSFTSDISPSNTEFCIQCKNLRQSFSIFPTRFSPKSYTRITYIP